MSIRPLTAFKRFKCCLCGEELEGAEALESHLASVHVLYMAYECDFCRDALFPSDFALREHYTKIHRKNSFTVKYRVSPELDERRELLRRLVAQSTHESAAITHHQTESNVEQNSFTSQLLKSCTSLLLSSSRLLNCDMKTANSGVYGVIEEESLGEPSDYSKYKALEDERTLYDEDNTFLTIGQEEHRSPFSMGSRDGSLQIETDDVKMTFNVSPIIKKRSKRRRVSNALKAESDQSLMNTSQASNEEAKQKGPMVKCSECKRMVGQYRNSMLIHVSTHHCDQPIFECLADGCDKKWYSISARTKEHIESKHGGNYAFLRDNRRELLPSLRVTAVRLFPALIRRFYLQVFTKMDNGTAKAAIKNVPNALRLVWVDCEMTGLPADGHRLVEIACIVTEADLTPIAEFGPVAISQPPEVMEGMTDWCKETFAKNGLLERIKASDKGERETEKMVLDFLREHTPPGECLLAGSSVHQDQVFLRKYMPELCTHLHPYRIVDVTTVKELAKRWYGDKEALINLPPKKEVHLALDDIRESIDLLKYCREHFFAK